MLDLEKEDIRRVAELAFDWAQLDDKTIFISGGTGFIGQFLINVFKFRNAEHGNRINVISCSRRVIKSESHVEYIAHDITQPIKIDRSVDYIIHLASNTHPKQYAQDPIGTITTNVFGTHNLLSLAAEKKAERFLLASSVEIYGNGTEAPMKEDYCGYIDCNTTRAGYNEAKRVSESLCQSYRTQYGIDCVIGRLARVFGADRKNDTKAIAQFLNKAVHGEDIVLKSLGKQRFSYCYVADAASGLLKILFDGANGEAYNISDDDDGDTLGGYASYIAGLAGVKSIINVQNDVGASKADYAVLDCGKIKSLGWQPQYEVKEALKRTYDIMSQWK